MPPGGFFLGPRPWAWIWISWNSLGAWRRGIKPSACPSQAARRYALPRVAANPERRQGSDDHDRLGERRLVGQGDIEPRRHACRRDRFEPPQRAAGQPHAGLPRRQVDDPEIAPEYAAAKPGAERLASRLPWRQSGGRSWPRDWPARSQRRRSASVKMRSRKRSPKRSIACSMRRMSIRSLPRPRIIGHQLRRSRRPSRPSRAPARPS